MFALVSGLALTLVAIAILAYLGALIVGAAWPPLQHRIAKRSLGRHLQRARSSDAYLARGEIDAALQEIEAAFYFGPIHERDLATTVANHHTALLSRLLAVASDAAGDGIRLLSLAKVDRLLHERAALQRTAFATRQGQDRRRRLEVEAQLETNGDELRRVVALLLAEVRAAHAAHRFH